MRYSDTMRQHELLYFVDQLAVFLERPPTREELTSNYFVNHERFVGGQASMRSILRQLRLNKSLRYARCGPQCHARHIAITPKGRALLDYWNEHGCDTELREQAGCERGRFTFQQMRLSA